MGKQKKGKGNKKGKGKQTTKKMPDANSSDRQESVPEFIRHKIAPCSDDQVQALSLGPSFASESTNRWILTEFPQCFPNAKGTPEIWRSFFFSSQNFGIPAPIPDAGPDPLQIRILEGAEAGDDKKSFIQSAGDEVDTTGLRVWRSSLVLSSYLYANRQKWKGKRVLELGSGCGLPGLLCGATADDVKVCISDYHTELTDNLDKEVANQLAEYGSYDVHQLDFHDFMDPAKTKKFLEKCGGQYDVLLGSDVVYCDDVVTPLLATINALLKPNGLAVFSTAVSRIPFGANQLFQRLKRKCVQTHGIFSVVTEMLTVERPAGESDGESSAPGNEMGDADIDKKWAAAIQRAKEGIQPGEMKDDLEKKMEKVALNNAPEKDGSSAITTNEVPPKEFEEGEKSNVSIFGFDPREHDFLFHAVTEEESGEATSKSRMKVMGTMPSKEKYVITEFKKLC